MPQYQSHCLHKLTSTNLEGGKKKLEIKKTDRSMFLNGLKGFYPFLDFDTGIILSTGLKCEKDVTCSWRINNRPNFHAKSWTEIVSCSHSASAIFSLIASRFFKNPHLLRTLFQVDIVRICEKHVTIDFNSTCFINFWFFQNVSHLNIEEITR